MSVDMRMRHDAEPRQGCLKRGKRTARPPSDFKHARPSESQLRTAHPVKTARDAAIAKRASRHGFALGTQNPAGAEPGSISLHFCQNGPYRTLHFCHFRLVLTLHFCHPHNNAAWEGPHGVVRPTPLYDTKEGANSHAMSRPPHLHLLHVQTRLQGLTPRRSPWRPSRRRASRRTGRSRGPIRPERRARSTGRRPCRRQTGWARCRC